MTGWEVKREEPDNKGGNTTSRPWEFHTGASGLILSSRRSHVHTLATNISQKRWRTRRSQLWTSSVIHVNQSRTPPRLQDGGWEIRWTGQNGGKDTKHTHTLNKTTTSLQWIDLIYSSFWMEFGRLINDSSFVKKQVDSFFFSAAINPLPGQLPAHIMTADP